MLFIKELKKICFSIVYILFIGLLLLSWHENFYGVTSKEIQASNGAEASITSQITGGSILAKPEQGADNYGLIKKEVPDKIMCGGTDMLIIDLTSVSDSYSATTCMVPAVPATEKAFWAYSAVPEERVIWWEELPTK